MSELTLLLLLLIILALTACSTQAAPQPTPTQQPSQTLSPSKTPSLTNTSEPTLTPSSTPLVSGTLNEKGPWLMYQHGDGSIYFTNPDGTGKTNSGIKNGYWPYDGFVSTGDFLALSREDAYLDIYKLPELELVHSVLMYAYLLDHTLDVEERSCLNIGEISWSPDGRYLAFTALIDGPSSDLYVYNTTTNLIKRLTWGEHQVGKLNWSPDSKWIVNEEYHGGRINYTYNMWASAPDGSENRWLYSPGNNQDFITWVDNCRFITLNQNMGPYSDPRVTNICTKESTVLYDGWVTEDVLVDVKNRTIALQPVVDYAYSIGIHVMSIDEPYLRFVVDGYGFAFPDGFDEEQGYFITNGTCQDENGENGKLGFKYDGVLTCFHPTPAETGFISPDQNWIFPYSKNVLCTYPEEECTTIFEDGQYHAIWRNDSSGIFVYSRESLYYIPINTLTPILIDDHLGYTETKYSAHSPQWIGE